MASVLSSHVPLGGCKPRHNADGAVAIVVGEGHSAEQHCSVGREQAGCSGAIAAAAQIRADRNIAAGISDVCDMFAGRLLFFLLQ